MLGRAWAVLEKHDHFRAYAVLVRISLEYHGIPSHQHMLVHVLLLRGGWEP